jgi:hypothetical protein
MDAFSLKILPLPVSQRSSTNAVTVFCVQPLDAQATKFLLGKHSVLDRSSSSRSNNPYYQPWHFRAFRQYATPTTISWFPIQFTRHCSFVGYAVSYAAPVSISKEMLTGHVSVPSLAVCCNDMLNVRAPTPRVSNFWNKQKTTWQAIELVRRKQFTLGSRNNAWY